MKKWHKVLIIVAAVVVILAIAGILLWNYLFGGLKHVQIDTNELGIEEIDENGVYSWYNNISSDSTTKNQSNTGENENGTGEKTVSVTDNADEDDNGSEEAQHQTIGNADDSASKDDTQNNAATSDEQSSTSTEKSQTTQKHAIINIAIFGMSVSQVYGIDTDRSDMNLIVSIDQDNNRICLTSILRDSKVPIEGHDPQKINAAYKYGGATLAIKTLNQNFHMNIANYITVNFESLLEIVDYFGGVEIELTEEEAEYIGGGLTAGKHLLDGATALKYASIRYIDSDFYRASRQQTIILALLQKVAKLPKTSYPEAVNKLMSTLESSMTANELLALIDCIDISTVQVVTNTIPDKDYETDLWGGIDSTGSWVYEYDIEEAAKRIHRIIYGGSEHGEEETSSAAEN